VCASVMLIESRFALDDPDGLHVEFFGLLTKLCSERVDVGLESRPFRHQAIKVSTHLRSLGSHGGLHRSANCLQVQQKFFRAERLETLRSRVG